MRKIRRFLRDLFFKNPNRDLIKEGLVHRDTWFKIEADLLNTLQPATIQKLQERIDELLQDTQNLSNRVLVEKLEKQIANPLLLLGASDILLVYGDGNEGMMDGVTWKIHGEKILSACPLKKIRLVEAVGNPKMIR